MKKIDPKAIIERIKSLRQQYAGHRGRGQFARDLGISPSTYSYYENNRIPGIEVLLNICQITGADLMWLLTGAEQEKNTPNSSFAEQDNSLLRKIDALISKNPELTEPITAFIELLCEKKGIEKDLAISDSKTKNSENTTTQPGWIPLLGRTAAGITHFWQNQILPKPDIAVTELDDLVKKYLGKSIIGSANGALSIDLQTTSTIEKLKKAKANLIQVDSQDTNQIVEFIESKEISELFPDSFALQIDGDSMSPKINDGDIVILSPSVPAADGQIAIAHFKNQIGVTCKLIRTTKQGMHLIPINERYETKIIPAKDMDWTLAVLCHIQT